MAEAREAEKEPDKQRLNGVMSRINKPGKELKALPRHPTERLRGKLGASFIGAEERMIEAAEVTEQLDAVKQPEREIRAELHSGSHRPRECQGQNLRSWSVRLRFLEEGHDGRQLLLNGQYDSRIGLGMTPEQFDDSPVARRAGWDRALNAR